jgi:hypothetical protein
MPVEVLFNAAGMEEGTYWGRLLIDSNDPDEVTLVVPATLEITAGICGDCDGSGDVTPGDAYMVLNYLGAGPQPVSCWAANVNGDSGITTGDGFHLLNYLGAGPALDCQPCEFTITIREHRPSIHEGGPSVR